MARLLNADLFAGIDPLAIHLEETLPANYIVVHRPRVYGYPMQAAVVGPQGIFVLHVVNGNGNASTPCKETEMLPNPNGEVNHHSDLVAEAQRATAALTAFMRDEFPSLHPAVHHLVVVEDEEAMPHPMEEMEFPVMTVDSVTERIDAVAIPEQGALADAAIRDALATALSERRLTVSQRASEPFIFRSGSGVGNGKRVWSIRALVAHMDKHPEDGIYHLRNGTLARWLAEQGAEHLAALAQAAAQQGMADPRAALETFLLGTGLVRRPRLAIQPRRIELGSILAGTISTHSLRLKKGNGRGYLFGRLQAADPWLRVEPKVFSGGPVDAVVTVDAQTLPISQHDYQSGVYIESSASDTPMLVPVRFRVVGMPSNANRYLIRPAAGLACAGLTGAAVGWLFGLWGGPLPISVAAALAPTVGISVVWATLIGCAWALLGLLRGLFQPPAWSLVDGIRRWGVQMVIWAVALALVLASAFWSWARSNPHQGSDQTRLVVLAGILLGLILAVVPATASEIRAGHPRDDTPAIPTQRPGLRPLFMAVVGSVLLFALMSGVWALRPAWQQVFTQKNLSAAQTWSLDRWSELEDGFNRMVDQFLLQHYDRRAPEEPKPIASPEPVTPDVIEAPSNAR